MGWKIVKPEASDQLQEILYGEDSTINHSYHIEYDNEFIRCKKLPSYSYKFKNSTFDKEEFNSCKKLLHFSYKFAHNISEDERILSFQYIANNRIGIVLIAIHKLSRDRNIIQYYLIDTENTLIHDLGEHTTTLVYFRLASYNNKIYTLVVEKEYSDTEYLWDTDMSIYSVLNYSIYTKNTPVNIIHIIPNDANLRIIYVLEEALEKSK